MSRGDLYLDLLQIVLNAAEVKKLIVVPFNEEYGKEVENVLNTPSLCSLEHFSIRSKISDVGFIAVSYTHLPPQSRNWACSSASR